MLGRWITHCKSPLTVGNSIRRFRRRVVTSACVDKSLQVLTLPDGSSRRIYNPDMLGFACTRRLPQTMRVLLEAALRRAHSSSSEEALIAVQAILDWESVQGPNVNVSSKHLTVDWMPPRVIMQDLTGVPALVDLAGLRSRLQELGHDPKRASPKCPVAVVIDHSIEADHAGSPDARRLNEVMESERHGERFEFLRWASHIPNLTVFPPGSGIVHQINIELLADVVVDSGETLSFDGCVGTDSHTPMVNGIGVIGWGVGGLEAQAAMMGEPLTFDMPRVIGVHLEGKLQAGVTATDCVLHVTAHLRARDVVGAFVEYFGSGAASLDVGTRATLSNMAPEYGATMGFFGVDERTIEYLKRTGRSEKQATTVEAFCRAMGSFSRCESQTAFSDVVSINLADIVPGVAGPKRPQDFVPLGMLKKKFEAALQAPMGFQGFGVSNAEPFNEDGMPLSHGALGIAAITSCTNTANPAVMIAAGLVAKKACELGLSVPRHVKASLAPGSRASTKILDNAGLSTHLDQLGFHTIGYGCTTCMGNSGDLQAEVQRAADAGTVIAAALSGNRNFENRIHPSVAANYLCSPPLVVAFALAGRINIDLANDPLGSSNGRDVFLKDIWPSSDDIQATMLTTFGPEAFLSSYAAVSERNQKWAGAGKASHVNCDTFSWNESSHFIARPPCASAPKAINFSNARCLLMLGDSITTDHISPNARVLKDSPAGQYLMDRGMEASSLSSLGNFRGNHEVMVRGTFGHRSLRNMLLKSGAVGPLSIHIPSKKELPIYDVATQYAQDGTPVVVLAGKLYGNGSSRDWAAKGTQLLGVRAVIAESFERIHRSNLACCAVLPIEFQAGDSVKSLGLNGEELISVECPQDVSPGCMITVVADGAAGQRRFPAKLRLDTWTEIAYLQSGGLLPRVVDNLVRT